MPAKNTASLSLPQSKTVRGYDIHRLALGGYLQAVHTLNTLPGDLLEACFPGQSAGEALSRLTRADGAMLHSLIAGVLRAAPDHLLRGISALTGIPIEALLDDPDIGLDGLTDILQAWVEVNNLGDFPKAVRKLLASVRAAGGKGASSLKPNIGSKG